MTMLRYRIGGGLGGDTSLAIDGAGHCHVESSVTSDRSRRQFDAELGAPRFTELLALLDRLGVWDVEHVRKRAPGEASATFEFDGSPARSATLWGSEVPGNAAFDAATGAVLALIAEISGGAVQEPGR